MRWNSVHDIYKNLAVTSTRYVYNGDYYPEHAIVEVSANPEDENVNQLFLPDKLFINDIVFGNPTKVASFHYNIQVEDYGLLLQVVTNTGSGIKSFRSDSLKTVVMRLHDEYNKFIGQIQGVDYKVKPDPELQKAYTSYNKWISLMMKISLGLALVGMILSVLVCASFKNEHPYRWYYLGALALDGSIWTIILLIDRHKTIKINILQKIESERLNTESHGASHRYIRPL